MTSTISIERNRNRDDDDDQKYVEDDCFWHEQELVKMQLEEEHAAQEYYKVTVTRSVDKQDQDFCRIECDAAHWPHPDVEFQYLMENLMLRQKKNAATVVYVLARRVRAEDGPFRRRRLVLSCISYHSLEKSAYNAQMGHSPLSLGNFSLSLVSRSQNDTHHH